MVSARCSWRCFAATAAETSSSPSPFLDWPASDGGAPEAARSRQPPSAFFCVEAFPTVPGAEPDAGLALGSADGSREGVGSAARPAGSGVERAEGAAAAGLLAGACKAAAAPARLEVRGQSKGQESVECPWLYRSQCFGLYCHQHVQGCISSTLKAAS